MNEAMGEFYLMNEAMDISGGSGAVYRYAHSAPGGKRPTTGGNYLFVRVSEIDAVIVFAGEADSLASIPDPLWRRAASLHGATHLYVRLNLFRQARLREQADLVLAARPVMNEAVKCS